MSSVRLLGKGFAEVGAKLALDGGQDADNLGLAELQEAYLLVAEKGFYLMILEVTLLKVGDFRKANSGHKERI
ncbi:MAG: hypothetical protein V7K50_15860 [Nostoc sp.]|uniref:hypothetical protein n=1 Tax=Nostoc sp. TaxID=1180 RepID=UPI002FF7B4B3